MRHDIEQEVRIAFHTKIESPATVDPSLPSVPVEFLGMKRRMVEIPQKIGQLLTEELLNLWRRGDQAVRKALSENDAHWPVL